METTKSVLNQWMAGCTPIRLLLFLAAAALAICGCTAAAAPADQDIKKLPIEKIWADPQCATDTPRAMVQWVADQHHLDALASIGQSMALKFIVDRAMVDWHREGLVWIHMGIKPSGGYALDLADKAAAIIHRVAVITVQWRQPQPGSIVTQQITSPCLVIKLPKENYDAIEIKDETGRVQARLDLANTD